MQFIWRSQFLLGAATVLTRPGRQKTQLRHWINITYNVVKHELTIPECYKHFDNGPLPPMGFARRNAVEAMNWDLSSINIYLRSRMTWLANTRSDEWLLLSFREMVARHGNSRASPKFDVTFTDDLNTEHRLLTWNKELSWSLCDYKYLAASLALTNTKASKLTVKSGTPNCIFLSLHSTAYNVQFISVLKILLLLQEQDCSE